MALNYRMKPTCCKAVEDAVLAQYGMAVGADQHTGLGVPEDVVLLQETWKHKHTPVSPLETHTHTHWLYRSLVWILPC